MDTPGGTRVLFRSQDAVASAQGWSIAGFGLVCAAGGWGCTVCMSHFLRTTGGRLGPRPILLLVAIAVPTLLLAGLFLTWFTRAPKAQGSVDVYPDRFVVRGLDLGRGSLSRRMAHELRLPPNPALELRRSTRMWSGADYDFARQVAWWEVRLVSQDASYVQHQNVRSVNQPPAPSRADDARVWGDASRSNMKRLAEELSRVSGVPLLEEKWLQS